MKQKVSHPSHLKLNIINVIIKEKGLGVPQSTNVAHNEKIFQESPSLEISGIAPQGQDVNNHSLGTDSKSGATKEDTIDIAGGAPTSANRDL